MRISRGAILFLLGSLTICFLGASYALWFDFNPSILPSVIGGSPTPINSSRNGNDNYSPNGIWMIAEESGIVKITAKNLRKAGLNFEALSPDELQLSLNGKIIPFHVSGEGESAVAYFLADQNTEPQEPLNVYHLKSGIGMAMRIQDATPENEGQPIVKQNFVWEEDRFFVEKAQGGDFWLGPLLLAPDTWTYSLGNIHPASGDASLNIELFSNTEGEGHPDHHVELKVNNRPIGHYTWDGIAHKTISAPLDAGIFYEDQENTITLIVHDDSDIVGESIYINSLHLEFMGNIIPNEGQVSFNSNTSTILIPEGGNDVLIFDVTNADSPEFLSNLEEEDEETTFSVQGEDRNYLALNEENAINPTMQPIPIWKNSLTEEGWGADYIAIVADVNGFENAIEPLLAYRKEQGLRVVAVPLLQIFHEFGNGQKSPDAIKDFLSYAYENWEKPAPNFVVLVGDATYDVKDLMSGKNRNRLPTAMIPVGNGEFIVSDSWFVQFDGQAPRMAIGRYPAQNAPQLYNMVEKTLIYEGSEKTSDDGAWKKRALLVADDEPAFDKSIKETAEFLTDEGYHVYQLPMSQEENIRYKILRAMNQGVRLINYVGYGNQFAWGDEAVLRISDSQSLSNGTRLPVLSAFSSRNGAFAEPQTDSLVETLLRKNDGGIAAAIAFSGKTVGEQHVEIADLFYEQLMLEDETTLGEAFQRLFTDGIANDQLDETIISLNLLGDPALTFSHP